MCDRLAVVQAGKLVEELTGDALAAGHMAHAYTREFVHSSQGYERARA